MVTAASPFITLSQVTISNHRLIKFGVSGAGILACSVICQTQAKHIKMFGFFFFPVIMSVNAAGKFRSGFGLGT